MNVNIDEVLKANVYQLRRLLDTNKFNFDEAHFIVFGDYPYLEQLERLIVFGTDILDKETTDKIYQRILVKRDEF